MTSTFHSFPLCLTFQTTSSSIEITADHIYVVISRVLCISWKNPTEGSIFLPKTAVYTQKYRQLDFSDIINHALMEVLRMFSRGEDPLKDVTVDMSSSDREDSPNSQASPLLSPVAALPSYQLPVVPLPVGNKSSQPKSFTYLLDCYSRVTIEERNHPKVRIRISGTHRCLEKIGEIHFLFSGPVFHRSPTY